MHMPLVESIADYHDIYLQMDVFLIQSVPRSFVQSVRNTIDLILYITIYLRMSRITLDLITDIDMCHFVENAIRGGISMITTCYIRTLFGYNPLLHHMNLIYSYAR